MKPIIEIQRISKKYQLGITGTSSLRELVNHSWSHFRQEGFPGVFRALSGEQPGSHIWALKDISFTVNPGEIVGLVGRNGCGKSTLLKILSKITRPTEGRAVIRGRSSALLEVGTGFHAELSGRENIYLNGAILGMRRREIDRKLDEIIAFSEIEKFLDTPVKRYSSGMYVRLAFSVAAHLEQPILFIDEVLAVGDAAFQQKCLKKTKSIAEGGRTILFVSHDRAAVSRLCNRCVYMREGKVVVEGKTNDILDCYERDRAIVDASAA